MKRWNAQYLQRKAEGKQSSTKKYQNFPIRKEPWFAIYQILECCYNGVNGKDKGRTIISMLQYTCAMSHYQMKYYTQLLEYNGMLTREEVFIRKSNGTYGKGGNGKRVYFTITAKGEAYMIKYRNLQHVCFNVSDGLKLFRDPKDESRK